MAAGRRAQLEAQRREHVDQKIAVGLLVVDHQHAQARPLIAATRACRPRRRRTSRARGLVHARQEQPHAEHRAFAGRALHRHLAAHQVGQHLGDGQAQAGTGCGGTRAHARGIAAREGLEDAVDLVGRHAGAGVLDLERGEFARVAQPQRDLACAGELDGVAQQVDQDLPHPLLVGAHHLGHLARRVEAEGQPLLGRLQLEHVGQLAHGLGEMHRPRVQRELAGLDVGDVERAFDQRQQVLAAALDHGHGLLAVRRHGGVFAHQLRIAEDGIERRAQLVADGADVAALGLVGVIGLLARDVGAVLGGLQRAVGFLVEFDLAHEQARLTVGFFLRHLAALVRQHQPPGHDAGDEQQRHVALEEARLERRVLRLHHGRGGIAGGHQAERAFAERAQLLLVEHAEDRGQQGNDDEREQQEVAEPGVEVGPHAPRQQPAQRPRPLHRQARVRLAQVAAAGVERAAQRTDRALVGGAVRHVRAFVLALADHAALHAQPLVGAGIGLELEPVDALHAGVGGALHRAARQVVLAARGPGDDRCGHQRGAHGDERGESLRQRAEDAQVRRDRQHRGQRHRADADRVDVPQVRTLELDARRRQAQRLVDDQVGHHRHHPGDGDVGVEAEHVAQRLEHVHLHQHEGDERVEDDPHDPPRVAVRDAGEEVAPGQRAGVGVGDVDLQLRDDDEDRRGRDRPAVVGEDVLEGGQVHLVRVDRPFRRHHVGDGEVGQHHPAEHLQHAHHDPARAAHQHPAPPALAVGRGARGHEAQVVGLLAQLRDERDTDGQRSTEQVQIEAGRPRRSAVVVRQTGECTRVAHQHIAEGHDQHQQPDGLRPHLEPADGRHAVRHQRDHDQRADQVAPGRRNAQRQFERIGHHGRLEREEDEGEGGVDQRGERGADVAEARATGEQVHVDAVARGVAADRQAGQEDDQAGDQHRPEGVDEAVLHQQRGTHRLEDQEGCGTAERRVGHPPFRHRAKALRRVAQGVVFQRLARHPAVVVAPDLDDALRGIVGRWWHGGVVHTVSVQVLCHGTSVASAGRLPIIGPLPAPPDRPWNSHRAKKTSC